MYDFICWFIKGQFREKPSDVPLTIFKCDLITSVYSFVNLWYFIDNDAFSSCDLEINVSYLKVVPMKNEGSREAGKCSKVVPDRGDRCLFIF
jgi:hypothetical protein